MPVSSFQTKYLTISAVTLLLMLGTALLCGCQAIAAATVMTAPTEQDVPAEYTHLPDKKVAVYVWTRPEITWDYPMIRLDLASGLSTYLEANVKDISMVEPIDIDTYIKKGNTFEVDPVELGRHFRADVVIHVAVHRFSVRDPGLAHFYRGRVGASVVVHDLTSDTGKPERVQLQDVNVVYPEEGPVGLSNTRAELVRQATYEVFIAETGKKFHVWKRPTDY